MTPPDGSRRSTSEHRGTGPPRRGWLRVLTVVVVVVLLLVLTGMVAGGVYYSNQLLAYPDDRETALAAQVELVEEEGLDAESVAIDGPLGEYEGVDVPGGDVWVIVVHGRGAALAEGAPVAPALAADDRTVLFSSYRNDGYAPDDPDGYTTFGDREWRDLQAWVEHAQAEGADTIVLFGFSMGGSVVASFLAESPDADAIDALVLDSPVLALHETLELQAEGFGVPAPLVPSLLTATKAVSTIRTGMDFAALEHLARWDADLPVLLVHGTADTTVPDQPTVELADQLGDQARLLHPEGVEHVGLREADPDTYQDELTRFLDEVPLADGEAASSD